MTEPQQQGCGIVNLFVPLFMAGGAVLGWIVGRPFGVVPAVLGSLVGLVLAIPVLGLVLGAVLGMTWLVEKVKRVAAGRKSG